MLGLCWKGAEQRTLTWPRLAHMEPLPIGFFRGSTHYILPYKAGSSNRCSRQIPPDPRVLFSCFKPPTVITSLASVITVGGLKHENSTLGIRLYLSTTPITTEQGVNTTSFPHPYFPLLNHSAYKPIPHRESHLVLYQKFLN